MTINNKKGDKILIKIKENYSTINDIEDLQSNLK